MNYRILASTTLLLASLAACSEEGGNGSRADGGGASATGGRAPTGGGDSGDAPGPQGGGGSGGESNAGATGGSPGSAGQTGTGGQTGRLVCPDDPKTEPDGGSEFVVDEGCEFEIRLGSNASTGYSWSMDFGDLELLDNGYTPSSSGMAGAGGTAWWRVRAGAEGIHQVSGNYDPPSGPTPADTWTITVLVQ